MEYQLQYLGKRAPVTVIGLTFGADPVWVSAAQYKWLTETNPRMFAKTGERTEEKQEVEVPIIVKPVEPVEDPEEKPDFGVCEKCGKGFKVKWTYEKHIKRCTGPEE
jgi:hypothetical protein